MKVKHISPLLESTVDVLSTMAFVEVTMGKIGVRRDAITHGDLTGFIDMVGDDVNGWIGISFCEPTILDITTRLIQEEVTSIDELVVDAVGEITNMVAGATKKRYADMGLELGLTRPWVVLGNKEDEHCIPERSIIIPFETQAGHFEVEMFFN